MTTPSSVKRPRAQARTTLKPDLQEAERFHQVLFGGTDQVRVYQILDDQKQGRPKVRVGTFDDLFEPRLRRQNGVHRQSIFVTLNDLDKPTSGPKNTSSGSMPSPPTWTAAVSVLERSPLKPHIINESSEEKFHVYWNVDGLPVEEFESTQLAIAECFDSDPSVALLTHVCRIPGFYHCKAKPFLSRIVEDYDYADPREPYTAEEIRNAFPPESKPTSHPRPDSEPRLASSECSLSTARAPTIWRSRHHPPPERTGDYGSRRARSVRLSTGNSPGCGKV